jgi:Transcription factor WhiB
VFHQIIEITLDPSLRNGACVGHSRPDWWTSEDVREQGYAKHLCRSACPVRVTCLTRALEGREIGIWGGMTDDEREHLSARRKHKMG